MGDDTDPPQARVLTYAEKILGKKHIPTTYVDLNTLPNSTLREGKPAVVLPVSFYEEGCDIWRFSLIDRLHFKGVNFQDVKNSFEQQWQQGQGQVQFIPMNRGFFIIKLQAKEDRDKILNAEAWMFDQQKLILMEYFPSFNADRHNTSHATVWVKFPGLPVEFWIEKTLLAFGKSLGTPIVVDKRTLDHEYGYYASVLIDINFAELDTNDIHIVVGGKEFWQPIEIQKRPKFCTKCKIIGHVDSEFRKKHKNSLGNVQQQASASLHQGNNLAISQDARSNNVAGAGNEWHDARRRKGKTSPVMPVVPEIVNGLPNGS
ncbi:uncharacterized protein LOC113273385 [Papaver somniferum]|uniref:uncharacterized protein LOC113273385 n=1 Tax=Papaver somniferum TaxID=3469 RepID=UPI000E6FC745|nr:uncharacterized protein LOC113273385 [Papaver somniferum]